MAGGWEEFSTTASSWDQCCPDVLAKEGGEKAPYFEVRNGWAYCTLCRKHLTDGHLMSKSHKYRVEMLEWESQWKEENSAEASSLAITPVDATSQERPPTCWGNPDFFEWKDDWRWWCILCSQWSDYGHVNGKRHQGKVAWAEYCNDDGDYEGVFPNRQELEDLGTQALHDRPKPEIDPWGPEWVDVKAIENGPSDSTGASGSSAPAVSCYPCGFGLAAAGPARIFLDALASVAPSEAAPPPGWKKVWSDEYKLDYYWNTATDETTWEMPTSASDDWC